MATETFTAGVHYGDFKGTAQADNLDVADFDAHLNQISLIEKGETLVGIEFSSSDATRKHQGKELQVTVLIAEPNGYDNLKIAVDSGEPLKVRRVKMEMPYASFFSFFKLFNVSLSVKGIIDGKEIVYDQ